MKKNIKLIASIFGVLFAFAVPAFSQQITKFGVVDTAKIYNAYFKDTTSIRNYEKKKASVQAEINRLTNELKELKQAQMMLLEAGDKEGSMAMNTDIKEKQQYILDYAKAKQSELDEMELSLEADDAFYRKLQKTLAKVAESGGYSMILSLQNDNSILWFSRSVDITEDVIKELGLK